MLPLAIMTRDPVSYPEARMITGANVSDVTTFEVRRFHDPTAFLERAGSWLLQAEAENNLLLGIAQQIAAGTLLSQKPVYLATVEQAGDVVGCAFRTPPYKLGLTTMPLQAIPALAADV